MGKQTINLVTKLFTHPKLSFEGTINHIMLQYFLLIHFLSKTSENSKILLRF